MSDEILYRLPHVMERTGVKKSFIWKAIKDGKFPKQIKLSARVSVWRKSDIDLWISEQVGA